MSTEYTLTVFWTLLIVIAVLIMGSYLQSPDARSAHREHYSDDHADDWTSR